MIEEMEAEWGWKRMEADAGGQMRMEEDGGG